MAAYAEIFRQPISEGWVPQVDDVVLFKRGPRSAVFRVVVKLVRGRCALVRRYSLSRIKGMKSFACGLEQLHPYEG